MLPAERRRFLAGVGHRLSAQALQRREPERRFPILLTLLAQSAVDVLDEDIAAVRSGDLRRELAAKAYQQCGSPAGRAPSRRCKRWRY